MSIIELAVDTPAALTQAARRFLLESVSNPRHPGFNPIKLISAYHRANVALMSGAACTVAVPLLEVECDFTAY